MQAVSIFAKNVDDLKQQVDNLSFTPTLGFIFTDIRHNIYDIQRYLADLDIFGTTSAGEIYNDNFFEGGISALLTDIPKEYYKVVMIKGTGDDWALLGSELAFEATKFFDKPSIILAAPGFAGGDFILKGLFTLLPEQTRVIGGFAGDDLSFKKALIFNTVTVTNNGLIAVILDSEKVFIDGLAVNGWKTFQQRHIITKSSSNKVFTIDERPALDVFMETYNISPEHVEELVSNFGPKYPALLYRYARPPVLRHPIIADKEEKSLIFSAFMPTHAEIDFGKAPDDSILQTTVETFRGLKNKYPDVDALIMFSCKARHLAFGKDILKEIRPIYQLWNKPMAGFFTYGEIGIASDNISDFHNETCNLLLIKTLD